MKKAFLAVVATAAAWTCGFAEAPKDLLTKDERKEFDALVEALLKAGFPDGAGATFYSGPLTVTASFDPAKDPPPLPSSASGMQESSGGSTMMTYGYDFSGLHAKLSDGSWIISLAYHFHPREGDKVDTAKATEVDLAKLNETAAAAHPFSTDKDAAKYLEGFDPKQRERSKTAMDRVISVTHLLKINPDAMPVALLLLHRAGYADGATLALLLADQRARNYWQIKPWETPDGPFDATGKYPGAKDEEAAWKKAHPLATSEAPQVALRRAMFRWARAEMTVEEPEDAMVSLDAAAAIAKAAVDPKDPQKNAARIDALLAGMKLPVTTDEKADLPTRLASWETRVRMPRMSVAGGPAGGNSAMMSTSFTAPAPAYKPDKADLDALVALLADERPSRFFDHSGPRTLGDNAWRALADLLKDDPRTLAGVPTDKPWTASERKSASSAVQKWWKDHRNDYVGK